MWHRILSNYRLTTQIVVIMVITFTVSAFLGSKTLRYFNEYRQLADASVVLENVQVHFKTQIQEWKNILLRGHLENDFNRYLDAFNQQETRVNDLLAELKQHLENYRLIEGDDGHLHGEGDGQELYELPTGREIDSWIAQHNQFGEQYRAALQKRNLNDPLFYRQVDTAVRGIDRKMAQLIDDHIPTFKARMTKDFERSRSSLLSALIYSALIAFILLLLFLQGMRRSLGELLRITGRLAEGDLAARSTQQGTNELAVLARAFNDMAEGLSKITGNVQKSVIQLNSSSTTLAASSKEQEASAKETEATTTQIVASTKEISATSQELARSMDEVARAVDDTASLAEQGRGGISQMAATISQMVEASKSISNKLAILNDKAANITSVVTTINKVADQTNLLSVNAAIEADKAGEYGIGFGTVATEIRRLADQTAVATWDIEQMVKEMQSAVSAGVMGMEKFSDEVHRGVADVHQVSDQLSQIINRVQSLGPHFELVHEGMQSQAQGADQINQALEQLRDSTRGTTEVIRQSNKVVNDLNLESEHMRETISVFKLGAE